MGGVVYHVLNRGNGRAGLFEGLDDYELFLSIVAEAQARTPTRIIGYCVMPNHPTSPGLRRGGPNFAEASSCQAGTWFCGLAGTGICRSSCDG